VWIERQSVPQIQNPLNAGGALSLRVLIRGGLYYACHVVGPQ
jgi:hypothetical protein